jgi:hypothetical protein
MRRIISLAAGFSASPDDRAVELCASSGGVTSYGFSVDLSSLDLSRFKRNPVVFYNHAWGDEDPARSLPVGRADNVRIEDGLLLMRAVFSNANPLADQVLAAIRDRTLRGVSIGTLGGVVKDGKLSGAELVETSIVPVPADAAAVVRSFAASRGSVPKTSDRYEEIDRVTLHAMHRRDPRRFDALRSDWIKRGQPARVARA